MIFTSPGQLWVELSQCMYVGTSGCARSVPAKTPCATHPCPGNGQISKTGSSCFENIACRSDVSDLQGQTKPSSIPTFPGSTVKIQLLSYVRCKQL